MEKIAKDANNHIELILLKLEKEFLIKKQISTAKGNSNVNFSSNLDLSIILKNITKDLMAVLKSPKKRKKLAEEMGLNLPM
jgi:hypothetical protein